MNKQHIGQIPVLPVLAKSELEAVSFSENLEMTTLLQNEMMTLRCEYQELQHQFRAGLAEAHKTLSTAIEYLQQREDVRIGR